MATKNEKYAFVKSLIGLGLTGAAGLAALGYYKAQKNKELQLTANNKKRDESTATVKTDAERNDEADSKAKTEGRELGHKIFGAVKGVGKSVYNDVLKPAYNTVSGAVSGWLNPNKK